MMSHLSPTRGRRYSANFGYEASVAYDAPSAISQCEPFNPELVITDVVMPGMFVRLARFCCFRGDQRFFQSQIELQTERRMRFRFPEDEPRQQPDTPQHTAKNP